MPNYTALNEPLNNSSGWDVPLNNNFTIIDGYLSQIADVSISTSNVTLTVPTSTPNSSTLGQLQSMLIRLSGALTGNRDLIIPTLNQGRWTILNNTTNTGGPWTVTVKTNAVGTPATVIAPQGYSVTVYCDGTNVYYVDNGLLQGGLPATLAIEPRVVNGTASSATQSPNADTTDIYAIDGLSVNITTFDAPSGTFSNGQKLIIRIRDNGTSRSITGWDTTGAGSYSVIGTTLPAVTIPNKTVYIGCIYNLYASRWDVVAVAQQV